MRIVKDMGWRKFLEVDRNRDPDCKLVPGRRTRDSMGGEGEGDEGSFGRLNTQHNNDETSRQKGKRTHAQAKKTPPGGQVRPAYSVNTHLLCRAASRPPCLKRCLRARIISATRNRNRTNVNLTSHNVTISQKRFLCLEPEGRFDNLALGDGPLCKGLPSPAPAFLESQARWVWESWSLGNRESWESWEVGKLGPITHHLLRACPPRKSNSTVSVRARQENASYSNAAGRCQKVEPGRRRGPRICQVPTENGFVGILRRKEESYSNVCALRTAQQDCLPANHRREPGWREAHRKKVQKDATRISAACSPPRLPLPPRSLKGAARSALVGSVSRGQPGRGSPTASGLWTSHFHTSRFTPHASHLALHTSHLTPHTSHLTKPRIPCAPPPHTDPYPK